MQQPPTLEDFICIYSALPDRQVVFLGLAIITWLVGANILVAFHYKRIGQSPFSGFKPFAFPFARFNMTEWLVIAGLAVLTFVFFGLAVAENPR